MKLPNWKRRKLQAEENLRNADRYEPPREQLSDDSVKRDTGGKLLKVANILKRDGT